MITMPTAALSTPLIKMLCTEIERELYKLAFGTHTKSGSGDKDTLHNSFSKISVRLMDKPFNFMHHTAVESQLTLVYAGPVSVTRMKPSFQVCTIRSPNGHRIPIWMNGKDHKSVATSSDGCFVVPWLLQSSPTPTMNVVLKDHKVKIPEFILATTTGIEGMPEEVTIRIVTLVPHASIVGKSKVVLSTPEMQDTRKDYSTIKFMGAVPAMAEAQHLQAEKGRGKGTGPGSKGRGKAARKSRQDDAQHSRIAHLLL